MLNQVGNKPETQKVGVHGFNAERYASDEEKIDWVALCQLPKFQMFACETCGESHANVTHWIAGFVRSKIKAIGEQELFNQYSAWHANKHYWDNETLYGKLLGES